MQVTRLTNILQLSTNPTDLTTARIHVGGWSESFWTSLNPAGYNGPWERQQQARCLLLPPTAAIVGYRTQVYTMTGNKLLPGGTTSGRQNFPGRNTLTTDLPQVAVQFNATGAGVPNTTRLTMRGMPDDIMKGGEYQPNAAFKTAVTLMVNTMKGFNFGFIGRDLAQASVRVLAIAANVITVDAIPGTGLQVDDFIRLNRVYDAQGFPVQGAYAVEAINLVAKTITVRNLAANVTKPSGTLRRDQLDYFTFDAIQPIRAVVKKVGRPSEQYRGRRSKVRA